MALAKAAAWEAPIVLPFTATTNASILTSPNVGVFTADADCEIVSVEERHETLGTNGSAVTLDVVKASSGTAMASGTSLLASTFNLKATINTTVKKTISNGGIVQTVSGRVILAGQCVGVNFGGTLTAVTGVSVTIILRRLRRPSW